MLEYTFAEKKQVWSYEGDPANGNFYSRFSSRAHRLENGNTLITVSDAGRAIEVTADKEVVWEFYNPNPVDKSMLNLKGFNFRDDGKLIATLFHLERVSKTIHDKCLADLPPEKPAD